MKPARLAACTGGRQQTEDERDAARAATARAGVAIHDAVAAVATAHSRGHLSDDLYDLAWELVAEQLPSGRDWRAVRALRLVVTSAACLYATRFLPPPGWRLRGAELVVGTAGRVDLIWEYWAPDGSGPLAVVYDELKTSLGPLYLRDEGRARLQAHRYAQHGERTEPGFLGVRLLFLSAPASSLLVHTTGAEALDRTPLGTEGRWMRPEREVQP